MGGPDDSAVARWGSRDGTDARGGGFIKTSFFKSIYPRRLIGAVAVARDARVRSMGSVSPASTRNGTGVRASSGWWHASCSVRSCDAVSRAMCRTGRHPIAMDFVSVRFVLRSKSSSSRERVAVDRSIDRFATDGRTPTWTRADGREAKPARDRSIGIRTPCGIGLAVHDSRMCVCPRGWEI